ncbi:MAG: tetratricopeptide repeat protein [Candidatus Eremiobacteraeota bacterium]|nr:tetratricopeptide repeat protein [Candidatus Eremiobacteraeota bacterium]
MKIHKHYTLQKWALLAVFFILALCLSAWGATPALAQGAADQGAEKNKAGKLLREADSLLKKGLNNEALRKYEEAYEYCVKHGDRESSEAAMALYSIGYTHYHLGNYDRALAYYSDALNAWKKLYGEEHPKIAVCYTLMGNVYDKRGDYDLALNALEVALSLFKKHHHENHPDVALTYDFLGNVHRHKGEYHKAVKIYEMAIDLKKRLQSNNDHEMGTLYNNLGIAYDELGKLDEALASFDTSISIHQRLFGENHPTLAAAYGNIGTIHDKKGDYRKAAEYYEKALALQEQSGIEDNPLLAKLYSQLGSSYENIDAHAKALACHEKALTIHRRLCGENHRDVAGCYIDLGSFYESRGELEQALAYYEKALAVYRKIYEKDHPDTARCYMKLGNHYIRKRDFDRALDYLSHALAVHRQFLGAEHLKIAEDYRSIGNCYSDKGEYQKALDYLEKALAILKKSHGEDHPDIAACYKDIAWICYSRGDSEEALAYYGKALAIDVKCYGEDSVFTAADYAHIGFFYSDEKQYEKALASFNKGMRALSMKKVKSAALVKPEDLPPDDLTVILLRNKASALYELSLRDNSGKELKEASSLLLLAIDIQDKVKGDIKETTSKKRLSIRYSEIFPLTIEVLLKRHEREKDSAYVSEAFQTAERGLSRAFLEMVGKSRAQVAGNLPAEVLEREAALRGEQKALDSLIDKENGKPREKRDMETLRGFYGKRAEKERELESFVRELEKKYPKYAQIKYPKTCTLREVQQEVLGGREACLLYYVGTNRSFLFVITRNVCALFPLPGTKKTGAMVSRFNACMTAARRSDSWVKEAELAAVSHELYTALVKPAEPMIKGKDLIVVPSGDLYFLPFEALLTEAGNEEKPPHYLVEDHAVSYAPSLSLYSLMKTLEKGRARAAKPLLAFGDPVYPVDDDRCNAGIIEKETMRDVERYGAKGLVFGRIEATGDEVRSVAETLGISPSSRDIHLGFNASEESLRRCSLKDYRMIHFACHGIAGYDMGIEPALVLSLSSTPAGKPECDGFLTMSEIFSLALNSDLVVLSACQTGRGKLEKGEGLEGISRAFLFAGSSSVVASLWSIADEETKLFMVDFYRVLGKGKGRREALREAKLRFIAEKDSRKSLPYYWAPFILIGLP